MQDDTQNLAAWPTWKPSLFRPLVRENQNQMGFQLGSIRRRLKSVFLQHVLYKTFTFEVFRGASKHPSEATFLNASQSKPTLLSPVMKTAELSFAKASEQRFCIEGYAFIYVVSSRYPVGSPGSLGSPGPPGPHFGPAWTVRSLGFHIAPDSPR